MFGVEKKVNWKQITQQSSTKDNRKKWTKSFLWDLLSVIDPPR